MLPIIFAASAEHSVDRDASPEQSVHDACRYQKRRRGNIGFLACRGVDTPPPFVWSASSASVVGLRVASVEIFIGDSPQFESDSLAEPRSFLKRVRPVNQQPRQRVVHLPIFGPQVVKFPMCGRPKPPASAKRPKPPGNLLHRFGRNRWRKSP